MTSEDRRPRPPTVSRLLGVIAVLLAALAVIALLTTRPLADAFFAGWVVFAVGVAVVGAVAAWQRRTALVWVAALLLAALTIVGMWSIGAYVAPAAVALLGSAVALLVTDSRADAHGTGTEDPPPLREIVWRGLAGSAAVAVGGWLGYEGVFVRELFTRGCASETLDCALAVTRWDAVSLTLLGLALVGGGGWLVSKQLQAGAVLAYRRH